ncbi:Bug family tripartite tricarboxylate transporter substrate binding protein [Ottowia testudinis]|uniref:Tripartite tricarboxylate transporter substrate binding protein n=1 Tax=Ottowia testudinis TaxID=2816950 RepID=A0A975CJM4_9BURK|nr:tripartite tricarboxylate transporter substrate binding protein [Ottowia testudinis]QTD44638.1 tripartite tricarboxylate transporter substrate binding protein [Ottowia testudinis]
MSRTVFPRRRALATTAALALSAALPGAALAQAYPSKPITMVVPFSAGGTTDILARIVGKALEGELGQPVVIDNKAGAGGNIGAQAAARAAPDGYTLLMGTVGTHGINEALYSKLPYSPLGDFSPITRVAMVPNLLVAHPSRPYKTVKELIEFAKAHPGKVNVASSGSGTSIHLSAELFKSLAKVDMMHVPYKGSAPAIADLLAGQTDIMFDNMPSAIQHVKGGKLRAIAVTTDKRSPELPDVPTIAEAGVPGYNATSWFGLFTQRKVPADVVARLNAAMVKVLAKPEVIKQMAEQGAVAHPETPAQFEAFIKAETAKWAPVVKQSGAKVD